MILDTVFLSHIIKENQKAFDKAEEIHQVEKENSITSTTLFELYYGAFSEESEELVRRVNNLSKMYNMKKLNKESILEGAELLADADISEGGDCGVGQRDAMIAGIAAAHNESVLTVDDDFEKLDVDVEIFSIDD